MAYTKNNTEGFSADDLAVLNAALAVRLRRGEDEQNASDAINNAWIEGATVDQLTNWPARFWILEARENAPDALADGIKALFNCREVDIGPDGDIWIADPQAGHWLDHDGLDRIGQALKTGVI